MKAGSLLLTASAGAICRCRVPANVRGRRGKGGEKRGENVKRFDTGHRRRRAKDERGEKSAVKENGQVGDGSCSSAESCVQEC